MIRFFKSIILIALGSLIVLACLHFFWPKWSPIDSLLISRFTLPTIQVQNGPLLESFRVTDARLVARESFELSFPSAGTIADIFVIEDQLIYEPIPLVRLDTALQTLEVAKARAILKQNQSHVAKLKAGTRDHELTVSNSETKASKEALKQSKRQLLDALRAAYSDTDDAIRTKTDPLFIDPRGDNPETDFSLSDSGLENDIESERHSLEDVLIDWGREAHELETSSNLSDARSNAQKNLDQAQEFLDDLGEAVSSLSAGGALTTDILDTWKTNVTAARSGVNTARTNLSTAFSTYKTAGQAVTIAEDLYSLKKAGTLSQDIDIANFQLEEAENTLNTALQKLNELTLQTPHSRLLVKKIHPKIGEHVNISEPVIVLDTPELKIQLDIPEEDMGKVASGNPVKLSLDAFPETVIEGVVEAIEPQEINKGDSIYFRASVRLTVDQDSKWRSGMGGTASVIIGQSQRALGVPRSAVYRKNGKKFVQVLGWNETPKEKEVETGISDEKMIEIVSGLSEHEEVVLYPSPLK